MEIKESSYDKVAQQIFELTNGFFRQYGIKPNAVYLGFVEFDSLRYSPKLGRMIIEPNVYGETSIFGLKIKRVTTDNYCAVGLVIE